MRDSNGDTPVQGLVKAAKLLSVIAALLWILAGFGSADPNVAWQAGALLAAVWIVIQANRFKAEA